MGLDVAQVATIGWSDTNLRERTAVRYARTIATLDETCNLWRGAERHLEKGKKPNTNLAVAECRCPRKIRVAAATLAEGPIVCGVCVCEFDIAAQSER